MTAARTIRLLQAIVCSKARSSVAFMRLNSAVSLVSHLTALPRLRSAACRTTNIILFAAMIHTLSYAAAESLKIGENLPAIQGETLAGEPLELPAASKEKITLVVFTFTKTGGAVGRQWAERFEKEFVNDSNVRCYSVMFLESVPRLFRGFVSSGIRKGIPKEKHSRLVRVYENEKVWKERLEVLQEDLAYLALLNNSGKIVWLGAGQFSEDKFDNLAEKANQLQ